MNDDDIIVPEDLKIPQEFIDEGQLGQTRPISKKGGPYTKMERSKRRRNVIKYHFEDGYSARQIAEFLKINRHTVDEDIQYGYSQLIEELPGHNAEAWILKEVARLESQRREILVEISKAQNLTERLAIQKMIFEIDKWIAQIIVKTFQTNDHSLNIAVQALNNWASQQKLQVRYLRSRDLTRVSDKTLQKIKKLVDEDRNSMTNDSSI